jgi:aminoglycoside phosphotransferase (APT) family kinase protein
MGLIDQSDTVAAVRLTGGVSSDIWKVEVGGRRFCVKRAMPKLAVRDEWFAPVERNRYERLWYQTIAERTPGLVPAVIGHDDDAMLFAMEYLDPGSHRLWKPELLEGRVDGDFAAAMGGRLAEVHSATAGDAAIAAAFPTGAFFEALRLEPYLRATVRRHPDLARELNALADRTAATRTALVHGDVSPKNIMIGPSGPVLLDAECAWYGDPAFDLAFCLNHLLLKCLHRPESTAEYLLAFDRLAESYYAKAGWETREGHESRAAPLLPGLFLARIDGKSPVEYVTAEADRDRVRRVARPLILVPPKRLAQVRDAWAMEMQA